MSGFQPLILHGHYGSPNPAKVMVMLKELGLPYELVEYEFATIGENETYLKLNPNGRLPTLQDDNTGIILWESAAILKYLVETYDKENKFNITTFPEKNHLEQFLFFQATGQAPYYGQWVFFHMELPNNKEGWDRYQKQALRVWKVLDRMLEGKEWLVGGKCTYADLAFVISEDNLRNKWAVLGMQEHAKKFPNYDAWFHRLMARPAVNEIVLLNRKKLAEHYAREEAKAAAAK